MLRWPSQLAVEDLPLDILSLITRFLSGRCISRLAQTSTSCRCRVLEMMEKVGGDLGDECFDPEDSNSLKFGAFYLEIGRQGFQNLKSPSRRLVFSNRSFRRSLDSPQTIKSEIFLLNDSDLDWNHSKQEAQLLEINPRTCKVRCHSLYESSRRYTKFSCLDDVLFLIKENAMACESGQLRLASKNAVAEVNLKDDFLECESLFSSLEARDHHSLSRVVNYKGNKGELIPNADWPHSLNLGQLEELEEPDEETEGASSDSEESFLASRHCFVLEVSSDIRHSLDERKKRAKRLREHFVCRTSSQFLFLTFKYEELIFFLELQANGLRVTSVTTLGKVLESLESLASLSIRHVAGCLPVDKATVDKSKQTIVAATFHEGNNVLFWSQEYVTTHSLELSGHAEISSVLPVILNGYLWVGYEDGSLSVVSTDDGTVMQTFNLKAAIWKMEYFDDSPFIIVCCGDGSFHLLSQSTGEDRKASTIISSINLFQYEKTGVATTLAVDTLTQYFGLGGTSYFICVAANEKVRILQFQNSAHCPFKNSLAHQETGQFDQALIKRGEVEILSQCFVSALSISGHCLILGGVEGSIQLWSYRGTPTLLRTIYRTKDPRCFNKLGLNTVTNIVDLLPHFFGASLARGKVFGQAFTTYNRLVKGKKVNSKR